MERDIRPTPRLRAATPTLRVRRGFTLMEAALATVIVGTGVLAAAQLFGACATQNIHGAQATVAMMLANNIQETTANLAFSDPQLGRSYYGAEPGETTATWDDLDDFDDRTFNPPLDARRQPIAGMAQYSQVVTVRPVYPNQLSSNNNDASPTISTATYTGAARVRVRVLYRPSPDRPAEEVYQRSWIRLDR